MGKFISALLLSGAFFASALQIPSASAGTPLVACVAETTGNIRAVSSAAECRQREHAVTLGSATTSNVYYGTQKVGKVLAVGIVPDGQAGACYTPDFRSLAPALVQSVTGYMAYLCLGGPTTTSPFFATSLTFNYETTDCSGDAWVYPNVVTYYGKPRVLRSFDGTMYMAVNEAPIVRSLGSQKDSSGCQPAGPFSDISMRIVPNDPAVTSFPNETAPQFTVVDE